MAEYDDAYRANVEKIRAERRGKVYVASSPVPDPEPEVEEEVEVAVSPEIPTIIIPTHKDGGGGNPS